MPSWTSLDCLKLDLPQRGPSTVFVSKVYAPGYSRSKLQTHIMRKKELLE